MPAENDTYDTEDSTSQWEFSDWSETPAAPAGGGLLRTILDEVTAIREGAAADRVALAKAISASFSKVDAELADVRGQLNSVRSDLDDLRAAVASPTPIDVRPQVQEVLEQQLDTLRAAMPGDHLARVAGEIQSLRTLLVGPS